MLLLQHGRVVYHGDNGVPVVEYFVTNFPDVRFTWTPWPDAMPSLCTLNESRIALLITDLSP